LGIRDIDESAHVKVISYRDIIARRQIGAILI
jgi:hypothetical protein